MSDQDQTNRIYGEITAYVHVAGYTFAKASAGLETLLEGDRWKLGGAFKDVNTFLESLRFDDLKASIDQRKRLVARIKELQPDVSNRQIARTLGVGETTVRRDTAPNGAPASESVNKNNGGSDDAAPNGAPGLSGREAAKTVARAERISGQQSNAEQRVHRIQMDAKKLRKFSLILADPPWDDELGRSDRSVENHYPTMNLEEICALPIGKIAHDQAMLFLWATPSMIRLAWKVIDAWGFEYRTHMVWVKPSIGLGKYARQRHELLLICRRGEHPAPEPKSLPDSVVEAPRGEHSAKPEIFHQIIERMYPSAEKIELFARVRRPGWHAWGNELPPDALGDTAASAAAE